MCRSAGMGAAPPIRPWQASARVSRASRSDVPTSPVPTAGPIAAVQPCSCRSSIRARPGPSGSGTIRQGSPRCRPGRTSGGSAGCRASGPCSRIATTANVRGSGQSASRAASFSSAGEAPFSSRSSRCRRWSRRAPAARAAASAWPSATIAASWFR
ncbi:hypothetical protein ACFQY7_38360 [Actinomadura luteofluorescens]|uniref:hypothetical protein n=1 Tax=Actinomadura luteofluorescens TaxID=46163 RepID=UPI00362FEB29